jgi:outer membrane beta-barrel protein
MVFTSSGLSQMGKDLRAGKGFSEVRTFDPGRAPNPEYLIFTNYQMTTYYGKVSVSKQSSFNLSLYGLLGLGMVSWGDATEPAVNVGFGQKFYFNNNFALRADLNLAAYRGPDPTSPKIPGKDMSTGGATYSSDQFDTIFYFRTYLRTAIVYLF